MPAFVWVGYNLMNCHDMLPAIKKAALSIQGLKGLGFQIVSPELKIKNPSPAPPKALSIPDPPTSHWLRVPLRIPLRDLVRDLEGLGLPDRPTSLTSGKYTSNICRHPTCTTIYGMPQLNFRDFARSGYPKPYTL